MGKAHRYFPSVDVRVQTRLKQHRLSLNLKTLPSTRPPYSVPSGWQLFPPSLCSSQIPPANTLPKARSGGSPIPAVTPPLPPASSLARHGDIPLSNSASGSERKTAEKRTSAKEDLSVERKVGRAASSAGWESTGAAAGSTEAVLASSGGAAAFSVGDSPRQMETGSGQLDDGSFMNAAARMEWIERQGNNIRDGVVDMEVSGVGV